MEKSGICDMLAIQKSFTTLLLSFFDRIFVFAVLHIVTNISRSSGSKNLPFPNNCTIFIYHSLNFTDCGIFFNPLKRFDINDYINFLLSFKSSTRRWSQMFLKQDTADKRWHMESKLCGCKVRYKFFLLFTANIRRQAQSQERNQEPINKKQE
jgi:hypothetical protein